MARTRDDTASWPALACAVGLLSRQQLGAAVSRDVLLAGQERDEVITAMEIIAAALLNVLFPADRGVLALQFLGLRALERDGGGPE
jgi:hypothetical protein